MNGTTDRQLLAEVHRWLRVKDWSLRTRGWTNAADTIAVDWDRHALKVWHRNGMYQQFPTVYPVDSVRQAVDLLVALCILPFELSSAYAIGASARQDEVDELRARVAELENMLVAANGSGDAFATAMDYLR